MAKKKLPPPNTGDIPAWFMTYSDVITLLMTFFILLMTFSTTEPDRFERIQQSVFAGGNGSGTAGEKVTGPEYESFIQRVRPRAARMAMAGSEMPPYQNEPSRKSVGEGIKSLTDDEAQQDVMTTNEFEIEIESIVDPQNRLSTKGTHIAALLAGQLNQLPVHLSVQCSQPGHFERATAFVSYLYQTEKIRPGQVGVSFVDGIKSTHVRFAIERYEK
jgi:flagellar motor protein MotB